MALAALGGVSAWAVGAAPGLAQIPALSCYDSKTEVDLRIAACTVEIQSGLRSGQDLGLAYFNRARARLFLGHNVLLKNTTKSIYPDS